MRHLSYLPYLILAIITTSCSKNHTDTSSIPTTVDTGYLLKTEKTYHVFTTGSTSDTSLTKWQYDEKFRLIALTSYYNEGNLVDTSLTTYINNQSFLSFVQYTDKVKQFESKSTSWYNRKGLVDSMATISNIGSPPNEYNTGFFYFYYDAKGHDTLELTYNIIGGIKTPSMTFRKVYIGDEIQLQETTQQGTTVYSAQFANGNKTTATWYNADGSFQTKQNYTYNNILSGGFYSTTGFISKNLIATTETISSDPVNNHISTSTYTLDSRNRVISMSVTLGGLPGADMYEYTYY